MSAAGRAILLIAAAAGGLSASQLPEFAQQYRQRLGGALDEMRQVVADFDADARRNRLTREQALLTYGAADEPFLRDRGLTMTGLLQRFDRLSEQEARLESAPPLMRPVVILSGPDERIVRGAWADFEPALPISPAGFIWAGIGFLVGGGLVSVIRQLTAISRRRRPAAPQF